MKPTLLLVFLCFFNFFTKALGQTDSIQGVLQKLSKIHPDLVGYIPETQRLYLITPREEAIPKGWLERIQDAFYFDANTICKWYGQKYLADWKALMAKSARESFWGASYLSNRARNYFGIRYNNKPWACEAFFFCETVLRNDPEPAAFIVLDNFEASLWMFIHTMYSEHFLERLPDLGDRIKTVIQMERQQSIHYWELADYDIEFPRQLPADTYTAEELIYTWSEHSINNLCVNCNRQTDRDWIAKIDKAASRAKDQ